MKKLFYKISNGLVKVECFKLLDRDETVEPGYEIVCTNLKTEESSSLEAYQPQAAIALADEVMEGLKE
jgi:hypothetical protein